MNSTIFKRLVWKEFRSLLPLWLTLTGAAIALSLTLVWLIKEPSHRVQWLFGIALTLPTVFALACTAMSFAGEREEGTDQLLCRLAPPPWMLLLVKYGLCVLSTATMLAVLYPLAIGQVAIAVGSKVSWPAVIKNQQFAAFAWMTSFLSLGLLGSLIFRRVLPCILATMAAAISMPLLFTVTDWWLPNQRQFFDRYDSALRFFVLPVTSLLASVWLIGRWDEGHWPRLVERLISIWGRLPFVRDSTEMTRTVDGAMISTVPSGSVGNSIRLRIGRVLTCRWPETSQPFGSPELGRLLWLEWRHARRMGVWLVVVVSVILLLVAPASAAMQRGFASSLAIVILAVISLVFGISAFQSEPHQRQSRQLAGHGVSPMTIWLTKQLVWTLSAFALVVTATAVMALAIQHLEHVRVVDGDQTTFLARWLTFLCHFSGMGDWMMYKEWNLEATDHVALRPVWYLTQACVAVWLLVSIGQCAGLLLTRGVTAVLVGGLCGLAAYGWLRLMWALNVPLVISVLPIIIGPLLATTVRLNDWLEERRGWRGWLKVAAAGGIPILGGIVGAISYRAFEYPHVDPRELAWIDRMSPTIPESAAAKATANRWLALSQQIESLKADIVHDRSIESFDLSDLNDEVRQWLAQQQPHLSEAHEIAKQTECARLDWRKSPLVQRLGSLILWLRLVGLEAIQRGAIDEATQCSQTLTRFAEHLEQRGGWWECGLANTAYQTSFDLVRMAALSPKQTAEWLRQGISRWGSPMFDPHWNDFTRRLHRELAANYRDALEEIEAEAELRSGIASWLFWEKTRANRILEHRVMEAHRRLDELSFQPKWTESSRLEKQLEASRDWNTAVMSQYRSHEFWRLRQRLGALINRYRAARLTVAIRLFEIERGELPNRLEDLVGPYLDHIPIDPWSERPFEYRREGFPVDLWFGERKVLAKTPLIWTPNTTVVPLTKEAAKYRIGNSSSTDINWGRIVQSGNWQDATQKANDPAWYNQQSLAFPFRLE